MTTYSKETALYNTGAIGDDIADAGTKATNYLSADSSGIMVYDGSKGTQLPSTVSSGTKNVFIDEDSMDIRNGTTVLAAFGAEGATIGTDVRGRIELENDNISMLSSQGGNIFTIKPSTSNFISGEVAKKVDIGSTTEVVIPLSYTILDGAIHNGNIYFTYEIRYRKNNHIYTYGEHVNFLYGTERTITKKAVDQTSYTYTISYDGDKTASITSYTGNLVGIRLCRVSYYRSTPIPSCAIGVGLGASAGQLCIGKYNIEDSNFAFIIGNGDKSQSSSYASLSNAFTVGWNGDVNASGALRALTETPTDITISVTSGTLVGYDIRRFGNVVQLRLGVKNTSATASGGNIFEGTISPASLRPLMVTTGATYYASYAVTGTISTAGSIVIRNSDSRSFSALTTNNINISFTYIVA